jgi:site-specific DNA recombinase
VKVAEKTSLIEEYVKALVIAEQQKIQFRKLEDLPPWPKAQELSDLQERIEESTRRYEAGAYTAERYFPSLARMEAREAELKRERRQYEGRYQARRNVIVNLAEEWDKPDLAALRPTPRGVGIITFPPVLVSFRVWS